MTVVLLLRTTPALHLLADSRAPRPPLQALGLLVQAHLTQPQPPQPQPPQLHLRVHVPPASLLSTRVTTGTWARLA
jgi:hypothetical protein